MAKQDLRPDTIWNRPKRLLRRLLGDRSGVGGVEFALIAPLLICLYITAFELTIGLSIAKRTTRSASTIADLVTQQSTSVTPTWLATMGDVTRSMFATYVPEGLTIKVTGIAVDASSTSKVAWSWDQSNGRPYAVGSSVSLPSDLRTANTFVVRSEVSVTHQLFMVMPGLLPSRWQTITISRQYFYRQRIGTSLACSLC